MDIQALVTEGEALIGNVGGTIGNIFQAIKGAAGGAKAGVDPAQIWLTAAATVLPEYAPEIKGAMMLIQLLKAADPQLHSSTAEEIEQRYGKGENPYGPGFAQGQDSQEG